MNVPRPEPNDLETQFEDLLDTVWAAEAKHRHGFRSHEMLDRMFPDQAIPAPPEQHKCAPPYALSDDFCERRWQCEACGQEWVKPPWYSGWQPA